MGLIFLLGPSVPNPVGTVTQIVNAKQTGAQGMHWSFQQTGGWYQANRQYTNTLRVFTSSPFVGPIQVQQAVLGIGCVQGAYYRFPLPELNPPTAELTPPTSPTEIDTGSFAQTIEIKQDADDARQWIVTIQYSSFDVAHEFGSSNTQNGSINPLEMAPEVHWSSAKFDSVYPTDLTGQPFRNTVGDPLENPPPREESRQVLNFTRNEAIYIESWAQQYRDSCNSDTFLGFSPYQVKCKDIQGKRIYTADYGYFWQVTYEFEFRIVNIVNQDGSVTTYGFEDLVLNTGLRKLGDDGKPAQITIGGSLITSPILLDQDGKPITDPTVSPVYLVFRNYSTNPFAFLNIPDDILTTNQ
jgi:hypothetical protein